MSSDPHPYRTNVDSYHLVVTDQGNAKGICQQFANANPDALNPLINTLNSMYSLSRDRLGPEMESIKADLQAAWEGDEAEKAVGVIGDFTKNATELRDNALANYQALEGFRTDLATQKTEAAKLDSGGVIDANNDDGEARALYNKFVASKNTALDGMPNVLNYWEPLGGTTNDGQVPGPGPTSGPGPGPTIPGPGGPGPGGPGPSVKPPEIPGPDIPGPTEPPEPGPGPGGPGPGYGPGPTIPGGPGGPGPGVGLDTGSQLAGLGGGPGPGAGLDGLGGGGAGVGGPGPGAAGPGAGGLGGGGLGGGLAGGPAGGAGGGLAGGGAGPGTGTGGGRGAMMMPMHGNQGDEQDRERSTWLEEEDDIWGGGDAPSGVIS